MAQRVFLIQMPKGALERAAASIGADVAARRDVAAYLAQ